MVSIYDVPAEKLAKQIAEELKSADLVQPPEWANFVKTGNHNERPPMEKDWWYIRSASILRTIYKNGPIGVSKLRSKYGGRKNRGRRPEKFKKGSGSIIRKIMQQLETSGLIKKVEETQINKGRIITSKGQSLLNNAANKVAVDSGMIKKK